MGFVFTFLERTLSEHQCTVSGSPVMNPGWKQELSSSPASSGKAVRGESSSSQR